jgi:hypothetical protein
MAMIQRRNYLGMLPTDDIADQRSEFPRCVVKLVNDGRPQENLNGKEVCLVHQAAEATSASEDTYTRKC